MDRGRPILGDLPWTYGTTPDGLRRGSRRHHERVASLGATPIDYHSEDFPARIRSLTGDGVDVVVDTVGGRATSSRT